MFWKKNYLINLVLSLVLDRQILDWIHMQLHEQKKKSEVFRIFFKKTISNTIANNKNTFIHLLSQKFFNNQSFVITKKIANIKLSSLIYKKKLKLLYILSLHRNFAYKN